MFNLSFEEVTKLRNAFTIRKGGGGYGNYFYTIERIDPSVNWPSDAILLKVCDDGWDSILRNESPRHFGGVVTIVENMASVQVYTD